MKAIKPMYVYHYPAIKFPTVVVSADMDSEILKGVVDKAKSGLFGGTKGAMVVPSTITDLIIFSRGQDPHK